MVILYVGNKLAAHGASLTGVETLSVQLRDIGYKVISVSGKRNVAFRLIDMVITLIKRRKETDLVLIDTYSRLAFWYAVIIGALCRRFKIPYIPILRGGGLPSRIKKTPHCSRALFKGSVMNVAPSMGFVELFQTFRWKVVCIPNNINLSEYTFKDRNSFRMRLLWVRSFHEIYNPGLAIRLLHALINLGYDAELCMVGPDKDGSINACNNLAKILDVRHKVVFTGRLSKAKWHRLAADYDIFINTTNFDNTPVSVIEAMALGLAVVSTNVGGIPYLLNHGEDSLLVNPDNLEEMLQAVVDTNGDAVRSRQRIITARKKVESYDWKVVKSQWQALFEPYNHA